MNKHIHKVLGKPFDELVKEHGRNKTWVMLREFQNMFALLEKMPDADFLVEEVTKFANKNNFEIQVLTAVPILQNFPDAERNKREWIEKNFPHGWKFNTGPHAKDKHKHAKEGDVLIDDSLRNIVQWIDVGGYGIHHTDAVSTIQELMRY